MYINYIHVYVHVYLTLFLNIVLVFWTTSRCCYNNRYNQSNKLHTCTIITSSLLFSTSLDQCDPSRTRKKDGRFIHCVNVTLLSI